MIVKSTFVFIRGTTLVDQISFKTTCREKAKCSTGGAKSANDLSATSDHFCDIGNQDAIYILLLRVHNRQISNRLSADFALGSQ